MVLDGGPALEAYVLAAHRVPDYLSFGEAAQLGSSTGGTNRDEVATTIPKSGRSV
jgi:hypothetical protein